MTPTEGQTTTPPDADPVVGHKTMRRKDGSRYHVPLRQSEAEALWAKIEAEEAANGPD